MAEGKGKPMNKQRLAEILLDIAGEDAYRRAIRPRTPEKDARMVADVAAWVDSVLGNRKEGE